MLFYYKQGIHERGPWTISEFLSKIKTNEITDETLVRTDQSQDWMNLEGFLQSGALEEMSHRQQTTISAAQAAQDAKLQAVAFSHDPLSKLPAEFGDRLSRAEAYAEYLERQFPQERQLGNCCIFPSEPAEERAVLKWVATFPRSGFSEQFFLRLVFHQFIGMFSHLFFPDREPAEDIVTCLTAHDFSHLAASNVRRNWFWSNLALCLAVIFFVLAFCTAVGALIYYMIAADSMNTQEEHQQQLVLFYDCLLAFIFFALFSWQLFLRAKKLRLPGPLRMLEKRPFRLRKIYWQRIEE